MDKIKTNDLFTVEDKLLIPYFSNAEYPYELLPKISEICKKAIENGIDGYTLIADGVLAGENVNLSQYGY